MPANGTVAVVTFRLTSARTFPVPRHEAYDAVLALPLPTLFGHRHGPLPPVREVRDQSGPWGSSVGQTRTVVTTDGGTMRERLTLLDPPLAFGYELEEVTGPLRPLIKHIEGRWSFDAAGTGDGVRITWTWDVEATSRLTARIEPIFRPMWNGYARKAMEEIETQLVP